MVRQSLDREMLLLIPFTLGAAASLGLISTTVIPNVDLGQTLIEIGGISWDIGRVIAVAALGAVLVNRDASLRETGGVDVWIVYVTIGLLVAPPFLPALENTLAEQPAAIVSFLTQSIGFGLVSYAN